jgi:hypothetical protein
MKEKAQNNEIFGVKKRKKTKTLATSNKTIKQNDEMQ